MQFQKVGNTANPLNFVRFSMATEPDKRGVKKWRGNLTTQSSVALCECIRAEKKTLGRSRIAATCVGRTFAVAAVVRMSLPL